MSVVLNTSAVSALTRIEGFDIIEQMFSQIIVPRGVLDEFSAKFKGIPKWIIVEEVKTQCPKNSNLYTLGRGEREAIVLARKLGALLVIEDKKARKVCQELKLGITGTFGIIRKAFEECFLSRKELETKLEILKNDLYYEKRLIDWVLQAKKTG